MSQMMNDEYEPSCPKCGGKGFTAIQNPHVARAELAIPMIICSDLKCQTVVGVLPKDEIWD